MTVHVGELTSEVVTEGEPEVRTSGNVWEERQRLRAALDRIGRDSRRTDDEPDGGHD
ncbi:hypothetical protein [Actinoplanes subglobosus]|uniref:Uncharacterized protein n=1 Tax=Actinoplanes subglobosus TaxID=1547892 RepID=A0ABV8ISW8_9ACTN